MTQNRPPGLFEIEFDHQICSFSCPGHILVHDVHFVEAELFVDIGHGSNEIFNQVLGIETGPENVLVLFRVSLDLPLGSGCHGNGSEHWDLVF